MYSRSHIMDPLFTLTNYIDECLAKSTSHTVLELYSEEELIPYHETHIYEEIVIPQDVKVFINELNARRIVAPETLRVLDHTPYKIHSLDFNIPESLEHIVLHDVNIVGQKTLKDLFPVGVYYRYENCCLHGTPLHELIVEAYKARYHEEPRYATHRLYNQSLSTNSISKKWHGHILDAILGV